MSPPSIDRLRVLVADDNLHRLDEIAGVLGALGHDVVAKLTDVGEVALATEREHPDVAIVGLDQAKEHALKFISEIVHQAACPVIVDLHAEDPAFVAEAAKRGVFAYITHDSREEMESSLDIVLSRYAEFTRLQGAFGRRGIIEQAKGILMERHGMSADQAFESLKRHARNTNQTVHDVAKAVTLSYSLFRSAPAAEE